MTDTATLQTRITHDQQETIRKKWSKLVKDKIETLTVYDNDIIAFASETVCLRLAYIFRTRRINVDFSKRLQEWYFTLYDNDPELDITEFLL